jgi:hypothetical protein
VTAELLPLADAFRAIVRASAPGREDLLQINSYQWFHDQQQLPDGLFGEPIRREEDRPAYEALSVLRDGVASGRIGLRGISNTKPPADIDPIHAQQGNLDVFAGKLTFEHSDVFRTKEKYTSVYVYAVDLPLPKGKGGRTPRFDRAAVAAEVWRLMDYNGEFRPDDPWDAQARLIEAVRAKFGEAADSTIEEYIKEPLAKWRESKRPKT